MGMTSSVYFCYNQEAAVPELKFQDDTTCGRLKTAPKDIQEPMGVILCGNRISADVI